ncbi:hypothetical protein [Kocuria sp. CNJ-770]|uniref:hypothetical protein n=1 Tax=Kocuria sp. CNJ-770 TaxID=1904964 RepID=UPI000B103E50|nr:hypothetical protein [Kocuria sp. CNJ-770]
MGRNTSMPRDDRPAADRGQLRPGERVEVHRDAVVHHLGIVDEAAPHLGVVWIRDAGTGIRRMLSRDEVVLHPCRTERPEHR